MRFNPLVVLWTYLGLDVLCGRAIRATPPLLCALLLKLAVIVTFAVTNFSIPLPVKVHAHPLFLYWSSSISKKRPVSCVDRFLPLEARQVPILNVGLLDLYQSCWSRCRISDSCLVCAVNLYWRVQSRVKAVT